MKEEVSAGIILFNDVDKRKFLLLNYPSKHWDFVKGKMEKGETKMNDIEKALNVINSSIKSINRVYLPDNQEIHKKVVFFLGKTETTEIVLSHEHLDFIWLEFDNALNKTTYENAKNLLKKSKVFLDKRIAN